MNGNHTGDGRPDDHGPGYVPAEDARIAELVREMHPVYGRPVPPPPVSVAQLRRRAEQRRRPTVVGGWAGPVTVAMLAAIAVVVSPLVLESRTAERRLPGGAATAQGWVPLRLGYGDRPPAARPHLAALAAATADLPDTDPAGSDGPDGAGRYTYVHTRTFARDATAVAAGDGMAEWTLRDEQVWLAADGSGRQTVTTWHGPVGQPGEPNPATTTQDHRRGGLAVVVAHPSDDRAVLAGQLHDHLPFTTGPAAPLQAVADLYRYHALRPGQRSAALYLLADTDGLHWRGRVADRTGRTGVAVSVDTPARDGRPALRDVAVFDSATGALLAYEQITLPGRGRPGQVMTAVEFLDHDRTGAPGRR